MKKTIGKGLVDITLLIGLVGCIISTSVFDKSKEALRNGANVADAFSWGSIHCILSIGFTLLILIHLWQHWPFIKNLIKRKLYSKNKITTLVLVFFILTVISFMFYLNGFTFMNLHLHSFASKLLILFIIIHFIKKYNQLICLFKTHKK